MHTPCEKRVLATEISRMVAWYNRTHHESMRLDKSAVYKMIRGKSSSAHHKLCRFETTSLGDFNMHSQRRLAKEDGQEIVVVSR
jgi:hypothetical protein